MCWKPTDEEAEYLESILSMTVDARMGMGVKDISTFASNLRMIADKLSMCSCNPPRTLAEWMKQIEEGKAWDSRPPTVSELNVRFEEALKTGIAGIDLNKEWKKRRDYVAGVEKDKERLDYLETICENVAHLQNGTLGYNLKIETADSVIEMYVRKHPFAQESAIHIPTVRDVLDDGMNDLPLQFMPKEKDDGKEES